MNYKMFLKAALFSVLSAMVSSLMTSHLHRFLNSIFISGGGPPTTFFLVFVGILAIMMKILFAVAYVLMGQKLPIKNTYMRAFVFLMLIWTSDYLPQVLSITGADGPIAKAAVDIPIIICDSLSYFIDSILLGFIFRDVSYCTPRNCKRVSLIKTSIVSALVFPLTVTIFDQAFGHIYSPFYFYNVMQVSRSRISIFYIVFYGLFIVTGALLPTFYRFTEYNDEKTSRSKRFGTIYSLCLWTPMVLIMIAFGASISTTLLYAIIFIICILIVSLINGKLLVVFNKVN